MPTRGILAPSANSRLEGNNTLRGVTNWCILHSLSAKFTPMATYIKRGSKWKAEICCKGIRRGKSFTTKQHAIAWAHQQESEILAGDRGEIPNKTFSDLLDRYAETVSIHKKGSRAEGIRIERIKRDRLALVRLKDLDNTHVADWRDRRLLSVSGASVNREKNLLSHVCTLAVREWGWLKKNPFAGVRMPPRGKPRDRIMTDAERVRLSEFANTEMRRKVLRIADFAVETGMRASEICGLTQVVGKVAILPDTKNGSKREVPLSDKALSLWNEGPFNMTPKRLDVLWRKLCISAGIEGLHFHDLRHTAITRLVSKLNVLELARMVGHKDIRELMTYYNESASDIAKKLG